MHSADVRLLQASGIMSIAITINDEEKALGKIEEKHKIGFEGNNSDS